MIKFYDREIIVRISDLRGLEYLGMTLRPGSQPEVIKKLNRRKAT